MESWFLNSPKGKTSTMSDGNELHNLMADGINECRKQLILTKGVTKQWACPLVAVYDGVKVGVGVISTKPLIIWKSKTAFR